MSVVSLVLQNQKVEVAQWLPRSAQVDIKFHKICKEFTIGLQTGPDILYDYYPFLTLVYVDGDLQAMVEFAREWEQVDIRLSCASDANQVSINFSSELGSIPFKRGAGADKRELSIYVRHIEQHDDTVLPGKKAPLFDQASLTPGPIEGRDCNPVFVIGSYRSGTSISTWAIGQHPNIAPLEETNWLPMIYYGTRSAQQIAASKPKGSSTEIYDLSEEAFLRWQGGSLDQLNSQILKYHIARIDLERHSDKATRFDERFQVGRSRFASKSRWVDGTPENTSISLGLAKMFPNARFILMLRRPEQVIRSLMRFDKAGGVRRGFSESQRIWEQLSIYGYEALRRLGSDRVMLTPYEKLAESPSAMLDQWFAFLGEARFPKATETFGRTINSSGAHEFEFDEDAKSELARLNDVYDGIVGDTPIEDLPLRIHFDKFEARENDIMRRMMECIGDPMLT